MYSKSFVLSPFSRTTVQLSGAIQTIQKKAPLKREDSFLKRFSTRQIPEAQETFEIGDEDGDGGGGGEWSKKGRKKRRSLPRSVVNPDGNFYFYWLFILTLCVLYNLWTLIVRQSFPELQQKARVFWILADAFSDLVFLLDVAVQFRTGYLEQGLMVYQTRKLASHYVGSKPFYLDLFSLIPTDLCQLYFGMNPMFRFPRFLKVYRIYKYYYMVESRTVFPNVWRVVNLIHILLLLAHWFGCFYYLISEAEGFNGNWGYPNCKNHSDFCPLIRKYLGSLYWSTLTLTTIGDLPPPDSNRELIFTIVSYLIGIFIFATIVGQVGNVITNRNANRLEFERLLRRVLRWYDYSWSRGRIQGGGDINTALGLLPDKLKTELALHVNLSVLRKVTIFQECQPEFLHDLVLKMKAYIFTPGDLICRKGEVAREMFIIADGILEVISETGKVLTTMQAGDFFGEIGILNLDGLNKRTADVRSVGYSELFSLSREDVLAAMKDYPEAQDILQTLGRKRLMEAKKASGPVVKKSSTEGKKSSPIKVGLTKSDSIQSQLGDVVVASSMMDTTAGKKIVEKLKSDVRGLRNAIRRSRRSNSSKEDSSEPDGESSYQPSGKRKESNASVRELKFPPARGVLKRMHNVVLSDEKEPSSPSTAGPSTSTKCTTGTTKRVQLPRTSSISEQPKEIIGEGLPLIQRLRLLRQKEERERKQHDERDALMKTLIPSNISLCSPNTSPIMQTKATVEPLSSSNETSSSPATSSLPLLGTFSPKSTNSILIGEAAAVANLKVIAEPPSSTPSFFPPVWTASPPRSAGPSSSSATDEPGGSSSSTTRPSALQLRQLHAAKNYGTSEGSNEIPSLPNEPDSSHLYSVQLGRRSQSNRENVQMSPEDESTLAPTPTISPTKLSMSDPLSLRQQQQKQVEPLAGASSISKAHKISPDPTVGIKRRKRGKKGKPSNGDGNEGSTEDSSPSPPNSPDEEDNETQERRDLKSILKKLAEGKQMSDDDGALLTASTPEGYAARHRKYSKNVTFQRQLISPQSPSSTTAQTLSAPAGQQLLVQSVSQTTTTTTRAATTRPFSPEDLTSWSSILMKKYSQEEGSQLVPHSFNPYQEECIGGIVVGVQSIIQTKMEEIQAHFQTRFDNLEHEVRRRDDVIGILQDRIQELESRQGDEESSGMGRPENHIGSDGESEVEYSRSRTQLEASCLFGRDDSIDTVISTQDFDDEVFERDADVSPSGRGGRGGSGGSGDRSNYVSSWAQDQDRIEMSDTSPAPWQLEFHRDRDSLPPPNGTGKGNNKKGDSVALDIGSTTDESSEDEHQQQQHVQLEEKNVTLDEEDDESDGTNEEESDSECSINLDNKNWEVQLLVKEMEKREEQKYPSANVVEEMRELENEIEEMKQVVSKGSLSPSELDMLESILQNKTKRMKALCKALSVESAPERKSSYAKQSWVGSSYDDFRDIGGASKSHKGETTSKFFDIKRLSFSRVKSGPGLTRQSSLYEKTIRSSSTFQKSGENRRESAGEIFTGSVAAKGQKRPSFLSRFNIVRQQTVQQSQKSFEQDPSKSVESGGNEGTTTTTTSLCEKSITKAPQSSKTDLSEEGGTNSQHVDKSGPKQGTEPLLK